MATGQCVVHVHYVHVYGAIPYRGVTFVGENFREMLDMPKSLELINFCGSNWG